MGWYPARSFRTGEFTCVFLQTGWKTFFFFLSYRPCQDKIGWNETGLAVTAVTLSFRWQPAYPCLEAVCIDQWRMSSPWAHQLALITSPAVLEALFLALLVQDDEVGWNGGAGTPCWANRHFPNWILGTSPSPAVLCVLDHWCAAQLSSSSLHVNSSACWVSF